MIISVGKRILTQPLLPTSQQAMDIEYQNLAVLDLKVTTDQVTDCQKSPFDTKFNVTGCFEKLDQTFQDNKSTFLIAGIVTMVIMVSTY